MTPPPPAADAETEPAAAPPSRFDAAVLRFGRFADRTRLLTVGGWGLFGVSTVLGAALSVPPPGPAAAPADVAETEQPARTADVPRQWPTVPDRFEPPAPAVTHSPPPDGWAEAPPPFTPPGPRFDAELPGDTPWDAALADLPPAAREDLDAVRDRFGSVTDALPTVPDFPDFAPVPAAPVVLREPVGGGADLAGLRHAAAVHRHNLANAFTPGFRRLDPVTVAADDLRGATPAGTREAPGPPTDCGAASNVDVPAELARLHAVQDLLNQLGGAPADHPSPSRVAARP